MGLRELYFRNFGFLPMGDIREIDIAQIPSHDILCAGFPCQPFSKAGDQQGFDCPNWGDLFGYVLKILRFHQPQYFILENVANLQFHDNGATWNSIRNDLERAGYRVEGKRLSPHRFGIPQVRDRMFIVGCLSGLDHFDWPSECGELAPSISPLLEDYPADARPISDQVADCLGVWQRFLDRFPIDEELPSFPIWSMEFGATYPYERTTPARLGKYRLRAYRGSHGIPLSSVSPSKRLDQVPSYARSSRSLFPRWKVRFIRQNREFYEKHRAWLDEWIPEILRFPQSLQKLEWNCKGDRRNIWDHIIQFRASGVRVKRPNTSPSLVAMTTTQIPIIGWQQRYITPRECAKLQNLEGIQLPSTVVQSYAALGNAVNARLVELIASTLVPSTTISIEMVYQGQLFLANTE